MSSDDRTCSSSRDTDADAASSSVMHSRSAGLLSQGGNADAEIKTRVSDRAADDLRALARAFDMNTSEFVRVLIYTRLYGVDGVARMTAKQLAAVAGEGPEKAQVA